MSDDPAIDAVRDARKKISRTFGNDPRRLVEHYIEFQKQFADRLVAAPAGAAVATEDSEADEAA